MIKQVISINRKKFATGLFWQPVSVGSASSSYARILAKNIDKKYNLYVEYKSMVGLTSSRTGARSGMPSAAAEIVDALSEFISFLGVFQSGNAFYLVAVRNGIIIKDVLFEDAVHARKEYAEMAAMPDWGALFAPESWGMPRSQEKLLSDIISGKTHVTRLRYVSLIKSFIPSFLFIVLFLSLGIYLFRGPMHDVFDGKKEVKLNPELAAEYKRQIELKNKELDEQFNIKPIEVEPLVRPFDYLPNMYERADLCYRAIGFVMQPITGWNQTHTKCDENYVSATFTRDFGTLNEFYDMGAKLMPGSIVQQMNEDEVIVRVKLPDLQTSPGIDNRDGVTVARDIATNFQQINTNADINLVSDTVTNGVESETFNVIEIAASSKLIPSEFIQVFNGFSGVYITSVVWNVKTRTWKYEVIIYAR